MSAASWDLHGAEICGKTSIVVNSSQSLQFEWEGYGLKLWIQEGSLPAGMKDCTINIIASVAGQYRFPENSHPVSAVFWFSCEGLRKFAKPITVEIQHCAKSQSTSKLNFVMAVSSQKQLPHTFKSSIQGNFKRDGYGTIELNSPSVLVAITQSESEERNYCSVVFYHLEKGISILIYTIVWNTEAHCNVSETCYLYYSYIYIYT